MLGSSVLRRTEPHDAYPVLSPEGAHAMKPTRREFLQTSALIAAGDALPMPTAFAAPPEHAPLDGFQIARRHTMVRELPGENFFEGMLLGNGDIGVCVVVRPDALGLHLGKSDSWDIRVSEDIEKHVLTFQELLKLWNRAGEEAKRQGKPEMLFLENGIDFFREYTNKVASSTHVRGRAPGLAARCGSTGIRAGSCRAGRPSTPLPDSTRSTFSAAILPAIHAP